MASEHPSAAELRARLDAMRESIVRTDKNGTDSIRRIADDAIAALAAEEEIADLQASEAHAYAQWIEAREDAEVGRLLRELDSRKDVRAVGVRRYHPDAPWGGCYASAQVLVKTTELPWASEWAWRYGQGPDLHAALRALKEAVG